ncbi:Proton-dependent oligopeptide transporter, partial [Globisporangium polare]
YLCVNGSSLIPAKYGYFATYLICAVVMFLAICFLLIGYKRYVHMEPTDKALSGLVKLVLNNAGLTQKGKLLLAATACFFISFIVNIIAAFTASKGKTGEVFSYIAGIFCFIGVCGWVLIGMDNSFLDASKISRGGNFDDERVDGYKRLIRVLPFAAFTIIWQCAYDQTDANFQSITQQCDLRLDTSDPKSDQVPGAMLGVFDPIVIVICIPILDSIVYPLYTKKFGQAPSQFGRVFAGLILATVGIFWSGIFEILRRNSGRLVGPDGGDILDKGSDQPMNKMYWAGAIPNYVFVALAECLINVTAYDVFYSSVPLSLKSTSQAVNLLMVCMGSIMTSVFTIMFSPYLPTDNLNDGHLEYMFFTVGAVSVVNVIAFVWVMKKMNFGMSALSSSEDSVIGKDSVARESFGATK